MVQIVATSSSLANCSLAGFVSENGRVVRVRSVPNLATSFAPVRSHDGDSALSSHSSCRVFGDFESCLLKASVPKRTVLRSSAMVVRCEQVTDGSGNSLDIWLGRIAMLGFVSTITVEITTGKGLLENVGIVTPVPTLALALTALVGVVTAFGIFRSASKD